MSHNPFQPGDPAHAHFAALAIELGSNSATAQNLRAVVEALERRHLRQAQGTCEPLALNRTIGRAEGIRDLLDKLTATAAEAANAPSALPMPSE